jgi:hypothetical protein
VRLVPGLPRETNLASVATTGQRIRRPGIRSATLALTPIFLNVVIRQTRTTPTKPHTYSFKFGFEPAKFLPPP